MTSPRFEIQHVDDFEVTGDGSHLSWARCPWCDLTRVAGTGSYSTRAKVLWSDTGLYFLTDSEDRHLTCTLLEDNANIFTEDVIEVFLQPDESQRVYFEYEISPLNVELPIMVSRSQQSFHGWLPWHYTAGRRVQRATHVRGGERASHADVTGWSAEFYIPFALLAGLGNTPPERGSTWRANIYRIDYDTGRSTQWAWAPATGSMFHDYWNFGTFVFK